MKEKIVINPLTRLSGFLEIEVQVENHEVVDAKSTGWLFRGFEKMLEGRPPLDAIYFSERICGICSTAHSMASALALEKALNVIPAENDSIIREIIHGCEFLQNHLRHFYQYTFPDYVKGPKINPVYNISGDYRLPQALNDKLSEHYLASVQYSRQAHKMIAILGGKAPHNHGIFVGGVTVNMDSSKYIEVKAILSSIKAFIDNIMLEDIYIIAEYYSEYFKNGGGFGNLMSFGLFNKYTDEPYRYVQPGVLLNESRLPLNEDKITENIYYAWYKSDEYSLKPEEGFVEPDIQKENAYSWIKAPRYDSYPMEVGPLARMWLSGEYTRGISTMDRTIARVLETKKICCILENLLTKIKLEPTKQERYEIPVTAKGVGLTDTTRGALGHWLAIKDKRLEYYSVITPTTWNISPTDSKGVKGVAEKALLGTHIENLKNPVEIGRIVRSFDPCVSCATHLITDKSTDIRFRVV